MANKIIVFDHATDDLSTNGLGPLPGVLSAPVQSAYDQAPQMNVSLVYSPRAIELLKKDRILMVSAGDDWNRQMFRINSVSVELQENDRQITALATHVAGDLFGNVLMRDVSVANANPAALFSDFISALAEPINIEFSSSISDVTNVTWEAESSDTAQAFLFGRDLKKPSFTSLYNAEWWFDNYTWRLARNVGRNIGIVLKYGSHLKSLQSADSIENIYTAVRPIAKYNAYEDGTPVEEEQEVHEVSGVGLIQYAGSGMLPVYDAPWEQQAKTGKMLTNGTRFKVFKYADTNTALGHTWYNLGGNQWIDGSYLSFDKAGTSLTNVSVVGNEATGIGTIISGSSDAKGIVQQISGVIVVQYVGKGKVAIWDSPVQDRQLTGKYLANGSKYNIFQKATDQVGGIWYNLGGNQWIDGNYISIEKAHSYINDAVRGIGSIKYDGKGGVAVWSRPLGLGKLTGKYLKKGSQWQIYGEATNGGSTWYSLGGNQWIDGGYLSFDRDTDVKPTPVAKDDTTPIEVWSYSMPGTWNSRVKKYNSGQQVHIYGQGAAGSDTWYKIGEKEWLMASYLSFDQDTDVAPSSSPAQMRQTKIVTLTLPEKYVSVPMPDGQQYEHQRIANFDASEYNIRSESDLRKVTQAYIKDNQIGQPKISLTVEGSDLDQQYKNLKNLRLYDIVTVYLPELGINISAEVTAVTYDPLTNHNVSVTIGTRPETLTNDLARWREETKTQLQNQAESSASQMGELHTEFMKQIFETGKTLEGSQEEKKQEIIKSTQQLIDTFKTEVSGKISAANKLNSVVKYSNNAVSFYTADGQIVGEIGAGGLIYYNNSGTATTAVSATGEIIASRIAGNELVGTHIDGAEINGGTITAVNYMSVKNSSGTTVLSADWGLSTDMGVHARGWSRFDQDVNVGGNLIVSGDSIAISHGAALYVDPADGMLRYRGGSSWNKTYKIKME